MVFRLVFIYSRHRKEYMVLSLLQLTGDSEAVSMDIAFLVQVLEHCWSASHLIKEVWNEGGLK